MAYFHSPTISTNGLVLCLDAANGESFRGEPTTNLAINPQFSSTSNWAVATNGGGTFSVSNGFGKITMGTAGSFNYLYQQQSLALPPGTVSTWSVYFKNDKVATFAIRLVLFDGASVPAQPTKNIQLDGTGGVRRVDVSATYAGTTTAVRIDVLTGAFYSGLSNADAEVTDVQFETKPYATSFVNGTRGTTVATGGGFGDLSGNGNHGELVNGPTYSSSNLGSLVFDGVDDYVSVNNASSLNPGSNSFSIDCWVLQKDTGFNGIVEARGSNLHGFLYLLNYPSSGFALLALNTTLDGNQNFYSSTVSTFSDTLIWMFISVIVNRGLETIDFYKNGIKQGNSVSITSSGTVNPGSDYRYWIAADRGGAEANVNISMLRHYNRALSAAEVLQNYNATKGRFGL